MSSINREAFSGAVTTALRHVLRQWSKHELHTSIPGIVESFDANTRRARIVPALRMIKTGETPGQDGEAVEKTVAVNVPVAFPGSSRLLLQFELQAGDTGLLIFSERGLTEFKRTGELANPDRSRFFDEADGIFLPFDFGAQQVTPAGEGAALQTGDAATYVEVTSERIRLRHGDQDVTLTEDSLDADIDGDVNVTASGDATLTATELVVAGDVRVNGDVTVNGNFNVNGPQFQHNGQNVGASHVHSGVQTGPGATGPPV